MFPANRGTPQLLLLLLYAGCFLLSLPLDAPRHAAAAASPISFSFNFTDKSSYNQDDLLPQGDAIVGTNLVDLTCNSLSLTSISNCTGRMLYNHSVPFYDKATGEVASFATRFTFKIVPPRPPRYKGDGMAFFLTGYPSVIPPDSIGGGLGLLGRQVTTAYGTDRFIAVVFDTYTFNVSSDHIGINLSSVKNSAKTTTVASLAGTMTASVDFNSTTRELVARLHFDDDPSLQPVEVSAVLPDPVTSLLPPEVAVGFSAATGANTELHQILA